MQFLKDRLTKLELRSRGGVEFGAASPLFVWTIARCARVRVRVGVSARACARVRALTCVHARARVHAGGGGGRAVPHPRLEGGPPAHAHLRAPEVLHAGER